MASAHERNGALEAVDRILNRDGEADDVLREVVAVLGGLYRYAAISFVEGDSLALGPSLGEREQPVEALGISFQGSKVAELEVSDAGPDDRDFLERVALVISSYCLVGWDTGGVPWGA